MDIDDILNEWRQDAPIDKLELGDEALRTQELHSKYITILYAERARLLRLKDKYIKTKKLRQDYWNGLLSKEDLELYGWEPQPLKIMKADLPLYLESDSVISTALITMNLQEAKIDTLESILRTISTRGLQIRAGIDWARFTAGV